MKNYRNQKLARRLALWAVADEIDHESVDKHVLIFSKDCEQHIVKLIDIQKKINDLKKQHKLITQEMIESSTNNIIDLVDNTENEMAKPLVDLAFWNRMQEINPELYGILYSNIEEIGDEEVEEE